MIERLVALVSATLMSATIASGADACVCHVRPRQQITDTPDDDR